MSSLHRVAERFALSLQAIDLAPLGGPLHQAIRASASTRSSGSNALPYRVTEKGQTVRLEKIRMSCLGVRIPS